MTNQPGLQSPVSGPQTPVSSLQSPVSSLQSPVSSLQPPASSPSSLSDAEEWTRRLARTHYENFSVVSWLLPRRLYQDMFNLYAYCRGVDDLGDDAAGDRLALLARWREELKACFAGSASEPVFVALAETVRRHHLPIEPFEDLIKANEQDQRVGRYQTYQDLLAYCRWSANPVGRLVLMLFGYRDERRFALSDATCTALQLANFWQDVAGDYQARDRIYLPLEDLRRFGFTEAELVLGRANPAWRRLMAFEVDRARALFEQGMQLVPLVSLRLRVDLALFSLGGLEILREIERQEYDVLSRRPKISRGRQVALFFRALPLALPSANRGGLRGQ